MKKFTQSLLVTIGLLDIITAIVVALHFATVKEVLFTVFPGMLVFNFFMYKLLTGWLIVNMSVKMEALPNPSLALQTRTTYR